MKIAVCVPCHGQPRFLFTLCLASLAHRNAKFIHRIIGFESAMLARARNNLAKEALDGGSDKILWLDADMTFPADALERLLAHDKPMVGANYVQRSSPDEAVAVGLDDRRCVTTPEKAGLEAVRGTGLGCFLMDARVLRTVMQPWFSTPSEDMYFFGKARSAGFEIFVDHDLSRDVGHIGESVFRFEQALAPAKGA